MPPKVSNRPLTPGRPARKLNLPPSNVDPGETVTATPSNAKSLLNIAITDLAKSWIREELGSDPVHATPQVFKDYCASLLDKSVQPYTHCPSKYFPRVAEQFGLKRYIPNSSQPVGRRGPNCEVDGSNEVCHKLYLPAFLYT